MAAVPAGSAGTSRAALLLVPVLVGVAVRAFWTGVVDAEPVHDATRYEHFARQLSEGEGYRNDGRPTAYWPIGYPAVLSLAFRLLGPEPRTAEWLNLGFAAVTLLAIQIVGTKLSGRTAGGFIAVLVYALYPADVVYSGLMLSELQFNAFSMLGMAVALSSPGSRAKLPLAGVLFGLAALTRAHGLLLPLLAAALGHDRPWRRPRRLAITFALLCLGLAAVMAPWWIRNAHALGGVVLVSTNGGVNLWIGNNPHAVGGYRYDEPVIAPLKEALPGRWLGGPREVEFDRVAGGMARAHMVAQPRETLALWPRKLRLMFGRDETSIGWSQQVPPAQRPWLERARRIAQPYYGALWCLALSGLALGFARRMRGSLRCALVAAVAVTGASLFRLPIWGAALLALVAGFGALRLRVEPMLPWLPLGVIAAFSAIHVVYFGNPRFHHPLMPWAAIAAGLLLAAPLPRVPRPHGAPVRGDACGDRMDGGGKGGVGARGLR